MDTIDLPEWNGEPVTAEKFRHRQKMARKKRQRREAGDRRTATYERLKADAGLTVFKMRKWLKSPYAFRRGGL